MKNKQTQYINTYSEDWWYSLHS